MPPNAPAEPADETAVSAKLAQVVHQINSEFALVLVGGTYMVLQDLPPEHEVGPFRLLTLDAFKLRFRPSRVWAGDRMVSYATAWLDAPARRSYEGITFAPSCPREVSRYYNLWRGWAIAADTDPEPEHRCGRFLAHLRDNVCGNDPALVDWVVGWLADLVQHPNTKPGTALVLQGGQGTGKTIVHQAMARLLGAHAKIVSSTDRVTGRFNSHLADALLLTLDEATWGGDHATAGRLKDLVTGADHVIEMKGKEAFRVRNYTRLLVTSNNTWVVPAGTDERRFAVLRLGDRAQQDRAYFRALVEELCDGGDAALLAYLLAYDLEGPDAPDPSQVPTTAALFQQQVAGLPPDAAWWLDVLNRGSLPGDTLGAFGAGAAKTRADVLHMAYAEHAKLLGVPRRASEMQLSEYLHRVVPALGRKRGSEPRANGGSDRPWLYVFPALAVCRIAFAAQYGRHADAVVWADPDAEWAAGPHAGKPP